MCGEASALSDVKTFWVVVFGGLMTSLNAKNGSRVGDLRRMVLRHYHYCRSIHVCFEHASLERLDTLTHHTHTNLSFMLYQRSNPLNAELN